MKMDSTANSPANGGSMKTRSSASSSIPVSPSEMMDPADVPAGRDGVGGGAEGEGGDDGAFTIASMLATVIADTSKTSMEAAARKTVAAAAEDRVLDAIAAACSCVVSVTWASTSMCTEAAIMLTETMLHEMFSRFAKLWAISARLARWSETSPVAIRLVRTR